MVNEIAPTDLLLHFIVFPCFLDFAIMNTLELVIERLKSFFDFVVLHLGFAFIFCTLQARLKKTDWSVSESSQKQLNVKNYKATMYT